MVILSPFPLTHSLSLLNYFPLILNYILCLMMFKTPVPIIIIINKNWQIIHIITFVWERNHTNMKLDWRCWFIVTNFGHFLCTNLNLVSDQSVGVTWFFPKGNERIHIYIRLHTLCSFFYKKEKKKKTCYVGGFYTHGWHEICNLTPSWTWISGVRESFKYPRLKISLGLG